MAAQIKWFFENILIKLGNYSLFKKKCNMYKNDELVNRKWTYM